MGEKHDFIKCSSFYAIVKLLITPKMRKMYYLILKRGSKSIFVLFLVKKNNFCSKKKNFPPQKNFEKIFFFSKKIKIRKKYFFQKNSFFGKDFTWFLTKFFFPKKTIFCKNAFYVPLLYFFQKVELFHILWCSKKTLL